MNSILLQSVQWGIAEVVDTSMHTSLMHMNSGLEARALDAGVPAASLKLLDFACVWPLGVQYMHDYVLYILYVILYTSYTYIICSVLLSRCAAPRQQQPLVAQVKDERECS